MPSLRPGVTVDSGGADFVVVSGRAEAIELCLFGIDGDERRIEMNRVDGDRWQARVDGVGHGQRYGYRAHGRWDPHGGDWFNPAKLLIDPYARIIDGTPVGPSLGAGRLDDPSAPDPVDSAPSTARGIVDGTVFDWGDDRRPDIPLADSIIYETHVVGLTRRHPELEPEQRGTYAGLAHPAIVEHLVSIGVTAVELLPVQRHVSEPRLHTLGLTNYWGYNPLGYFAVHHPYAAGSAMTAIDEFRAMVAALHAAGIEVILDVVYNHTAEGDHRGPMYSWRGLDNHAYYRLDADDPMRYTDVAGTGNCLDASSPTVIEMVLDSLRYWVSEMHVDGFRFDLATALGRTGPDHRYRTDAPLLAAIEADPVLSAVKMIAEPWDIGPDGHRLGGFPHRWSEWNDRFRDTMRRFWRGDPSEIARFADRFAASSDIFGDRPPGASINYITSHDGFTLTDLVSHDERHNLANGEDNRDGPADERSWNNGVEGPTDDPAILGRRARDRRNLMATLLLAPGVPMILGGDEIGRTQRGNNNAYCQDNDISWYDWDSIDRSMLDWVTTLTGLRRRHAVLRHDSRFGDGIGPPPLDGRWSTTDRVSMIWSTPDGHRMTDDDWQRSQRPLVAVFFDGQPLGSASLLVLVNGSDEDREWTLPTVDRPIRWRTVISSVETARPTTAISDRLVVAARSITVLDDTDG